MKCLYTIKVCQNIEKVVRIEILNKKNWLPTTVMIASILWTSILLWHCTELVHFSQSWSQYVCIYYL